jgi:hypothetical protein
MRGISPGAAQLIAGIGSIGSIHDLGMYISWTPQTRISPAKASFHKTPATSRMRAQILYTLRRKLDISYTACWEAGFYTEN